MELLFKHKFVKVLTNSFSQFLIRFLYSLTSFAAILLMSYFLGFTMFGSFTKITVFVSSFYLLVDFSLNPIFIKDYHKDTRRLFGNLFFLRLLLATFLFLAAAGLAIFLPYNEHSGIGFSPKEKIGVLVFSFTLLSQALIYSLNSLLQQKLLYSLSLIPYFVSSLILLITVFFGIQQKNLFIILLAYTLSQTAVFILTYSAFVKKYPLQLSTHDFFQFARKLLLSSFPVALMLFLNVIYFRADSFILSLSKSTFEVGVYGFSYKIFEFIIAIPTFFANSIYPILIEKLDDSRIFHSLIRSYAFLLFLASIFCAASLFLFAPILGLFKQEFIYSVTPLRLLSLSVPFFFLTSLFQWILVIKNKTGVLLLIYFSSMMLNIFFNFLLIPHYSYFAAATITVFSEAFIFLCMTSYLFIHKTKIFRTN